MRGTSKIALAAVFGLLSVGLVVGQPGGGKGGGFGGGFGGGGFGPPQDAYSAVKNKNVQKEINFTDDQMQELTTAVDKAVKGVLNDKQAKRVAQIVLQGKGVNAYKDPKIQEQLKLTKAQKDDLTSLFADFEKDSEKALKDAKGFEGMKKVGELRKELTERVTGVLTADQKKTYETMIGEKFDFGGKKPKKDDA